MDGEAIGISLACLMVFGLIALSLYGAKEKTNKHDTSKPWRHWGGS